MKRSSIIAGVFMVAVALVFISSPGDASANHYTYMQEDDYLRQRWGKVFDYNGSFSGWALTTYPSEWDDDDTITSHVNSAIAKWEAAVPQLDLAETHDGWYYLWFETRECGRNAQGCMVLVETDPLYDRRADYLLWADIRLDTSSARAMSTTGKVDTLLHEIGHWMGLDDAYVDGLGGTTRCSTIHSVMNKGGARGENCSGAHSPTVRDINAISGYWNGDMPSHLTLVELPNNVLQLSWLDGMWSEGTNWVGLWYWDDDEDEFVYAEDSWVEADTGFHKDTVRRYIRKQWNVQAKGWPTDTEYYAGVMGWSWPWRSYSPPAWSNTLDME